jgi:hypothetical protein
VTASGLLRPARLRHAGSARRELMHDLSPESGIQPSTYVPNKCVGGGDFELEVTRIVDTSSLGRKAFMMPASRPDDAVMAGPRSDGPRRVR